MPKFLPSSFCDERGHVATILRFASYHPELVQLETVEDPYRREVEIRISFKCTREALFDMLDRESNSSKHERARDLEPHMWKRSVMPSDEIAGMFKGIDRAADEGDFSARVAWPANFKPWSAAAAEMEEEDDERELKAEAGPDDEEEMKEKTK